VASLFSDLLNFLSNVRNAIQSSGGAVGAKVGNPPKVTQPNTSTWTNIRSAVQSSGGVVGAKLGTLPKTTTTAKPAPKPAPAKPASKPAPKPALKTTSKPSPSYIKVGDRGSSVAEVQRLLAAAGFNPGKIDGIFGSKTLAAVKAFQRAHGLAVDGIVGPKTMAALRAAASRKTTSAPKTTATKSTAAPTKSTTSTARSATTSTAKPATSSSTSTDTSTASSVPNIPMPNLPQLPGPSPLLPFILSLMASGPQVSVNVDELMQKAQERAAAEYADVASSLNRALQTLQQQQQLVQQQFEQARRDLVRQHAVENFLDLRKLEQQMANRGMDGSGIAADAAVRLGMASQQALDSALRDLNTQQAQALLELNQQYAELSDQIAQLPQKQAARAQELLDYLYDKALEQQSTVASLQRDFLATLLPYISPSMNEILQARNQRDLGLLNAWISQYQHLTPSGNARLQAELQRYMHDTPSGDTQARIAFERWAHLTPSAADLIREQLGLLENELGWARLEAERAKSSAPTKADLAMDRLSAYLSRLPAQARAQALVKIANGGKSAILQDKALAGLIGYPEIAGASDADVKQAAWMLMSLTSGK